MSAASATPGTTTTNGVLAGRGRNLGLALLAFTITFWAWNIIGPLGVRYAQELGLSAPEKSLLVATPVLVGSLGRILTGALTDRFGGRLMFTVLTAASAVPVLLVALAGAIGSYLLLLVFGPPGAGSPPDCSAPAWAAPHCRPSSLRGSCAGSDTCPPT
jgi:NNP family nitrate/nitrite transporter-like MFS transporter